MTTNTDSAPESGWSEPMEMRGGVQLRVRLNPMYFHPEVQRLENGEWVNGGKGDYDDVLARLYSERRALETALRALVTELFHDASYKTSAMGYIDTLRYCARKIETLLTTSPATMAATATSAPSEREARLVEWALQQMSEQIAKDFYIGTSLTPSGEVFVRDEEYVLGLFGAIAAEVLAALDAPADGGGEGVTAR